MFFMQLLCCRDFYKILSGEKKIFYRNFSKQHGFASQEFLVIRGNDWGFLWSGRHTRPPLVGGGGVSHSVG